MKMLSSLLAATIASASLAAHALGELADLAIEDRATGVELPVYWSEGRAYVAGKPRGEYRVVLRNRMGEDLLAVVAVDGLNTVTGEAVAAHQSGYVLAPWSRLDIDGWRKSLSQTAAFYFTSIGRSYAARTGRPEHVGVIGVALFRRAPVYYEPEMEIDKRAGGAKSGPKHARPGTPLGTGHGRRELAPAQWGEFQRSTLEPVETLAIFYDSYPNLVAQGVVPTAFDTGFVPDPPRRR
jgi:hypothetical protein